MNGVSTESFGEGNVDDYDDEEDEDFEDENGEGHEEGHEEGHDGSHDGSYFGGKDAVHIGKNELAKQVAENRPVDPGDFNLDPSRFETEHQAWLLEREAYVKAVEAYEAELAYVEAVRPRKRSECTDVPRPFVSCRYNPYLDVTSNGGLVLNHPEVDPDEVDPRESCVLDIAKRTQGMILEEVGVLMNFTRERARQIEARAAGRIRYHIPLDLIADFLDE